ncbi:MAG: aldehyde dehydrogenase [Bacteroidales bacterium]|nr:aldehyde dehydrogenase [Bacteroidales bacterium]
MNEQELKELNIKQLEFFRKGLTLQLDFRIETLNRIKNLIIKFEGKLFEALHEDLGKPPFESYASETGVVLQELNLLIRNLKKWAQPKRVYTPLVHFIATSKFQYEPFGRVLIISPWNYPFQLLFNPLIGAIAAGNCVVAKPSKHAIHTTAVMTEMINNHFDREYIHIIEGSSEVNQYLLKQKYDYIFFTGSSTVARQVMKEASNNLTPVSLELGGKNPAIVTADANLKLAAKRILWGKLLNAGQSCVATDYVLVNSSVKPKLLREMKRYLDKWYGNDSQQSNDLCRIINRENTERLQKLIVPEKTFTGGRSDLEQHYIEPTILDGVADSDPVMQEEVFGPILPILTFESLDEAIQKVLDRPRPLALYIFSNSRKKQKTIINKTQSGTVCINESVMHFINPYLPFGGIGQSGMGRYHGRYSFETFSYKRPVMKKSNILDINLRYPPYKNKIRIIRLFMR